ncbi:MAG: hypothetical protein HY581_00070 [Nitrospirae bacterium]|nr:hypothetical protein [Nitrospirota bacterium]
MAWGIIMTALMLFGMFVLVIADVGAPELPPAASADTESKESTDDKEDMRKAA